MGLMMWMMMRGTKDASADDRSNQQSADLVRLQAEIDQLRAERGHERVDQVRQGP